MTSESQERMLAIVEPDDLDEVLAICARWEVDASVIGRVTEGGRLRIMDGFDGEVLADVPAATLHEDAPLYDRPRREPSDRPRAARPTCDCPDPGADLLAELTDTSWVWSQYDHQLFLNTVEGPGGDATVLRLKHPTTGEDTGRGLALTTDGNHRWCAVDPRQGTAMTVAESVMNLACVGAHPIALVNCLNFGNPEHPEVMWQLSEAVDGMTEACEAFGVPVVGGNVSLYNESSGTDIDPTPVVGLLGLVDDLDRQPPGVALVDGGRLLLLGDDRPGAGGLDLGRRPRAPGGRTAARPRPAAVQRRRRPGPAAGRPTASWPACTTWPPAASAAPWARWRCGRASASRWPGSPTTPSSSPNRSAARSCASTPTTWPRSSAARRTPAWRPPASVSPAAIASGSRTSSTSRSTTPSRRGGTACPTPSAASSEPAERGRAISDRHPIGPPPERTSHRPATRSDWIG